MQRSDVAVLIPAYRPDARLCELIEALKALGFARIVAVDDGSGASCADFFARARALGATVLTHEVNRGKGAALKTGFENIGARPVVTCDADGQHTPQDVLAIAEALTANPGALILGCRDKRRMPLKSKLGNNLTCFFLGLLTGLWISDTQTGLRGIPACAMAAFSELEGDRYEYETNMLLKARRMRLPVKEVVIETVYFDNNAESHFKPLQDGWRIYRLLFKQMALYLGSSSVAGLVDILAFTALHYLLPEEIGLHASGFWAFLLPASVGVPALIARAASALVNYLLNRELVFKSRAGKRSLFAYYLLTAFVLLCDIQLIRFFTHLGIQTIVAKVLADACMFVVSYNVQQRVIFKE